MSTTMRLRGGQRKLVLLLHIAATGAWLGLDVVLAVLVFTARGTSDPQTAAFCFRALEVVAVWPIATAALASLATGVLLGLGSKYGLVRYWWVAVKLVMNVILGVLVLFALRPAVHEAGGSGRRIAAELPVSYDSTSLMMPPIVSTTALVFAFVLSVYKPWGRTRANPA